MMTIPIKIAQSYLKPEKTSKLTRKNAKNDEEFNFKGLCR